MSIASFKDSSPQSAIQYFLFNYHYLFISSRSFSSCLRLFHRLFLPSIFPSVTWFRRQFLCKMWPIQLALLLLCNTTFFISYIQIIFSNLLQHYISKVSRYLRSTFHRVQLSAPHKDTLQCVIWLVSFLNLSRICW